MKRRSNSTSKSEPKAKRSVGLLKPSNPLLPNISGVKKWVQSSKPVLSDSKVAQLSNQLDFSTLIDYLNSLDHNAVLVGIRAFSRVITDQGSNTPNALLMQYLQNSPSCIEIFQIFERFEKINVAESPMALQALIEWLQLVILILSTNKWMHLQHSNFAICHELAKNQLACLKKLTKISEDLVIHVLNLLTEIITMGVYYARQVIKYYDFSNKVVLNCFMRIKVAFQNRFPGHNNRNVVIRLTCAILQLNDTTSIGHLLSHTHIMPLIFKLLHLDRPYNVIQFLKYMQNHVLLNQDINKKIKINFFSSTILRALGDVVIEYLNNEKVEKVILLFLHILLTSPKFGILRPNKPKPFSTALQWVKTQPTIYRTTTHHLSNAPNSSSQMNSSSHFESNYTMFRNVRFISILRLLHPTRPSHQQLILAVLQQDVGLYREYLDLQRPNKNFGTSQWVSNNIFHLQLIQHQRIDYGGIFLAYYQNGIHPSTLLGWIVAKAYFERPALVQALSHRSNISIFTALSFIKHMFNLLEKMELQMKRYNRLYHQDSTIDDKVTRGNNLIMDLWHAMKNEFMNSLPEFRIIFSLYQRVIASNTIQERIKTGWIYKQERVGGKVDDHGSKEEDVHSCAKLDHPGHQIDDHSGYQSSLIQPIEDPGHILASESPSSNGVNNLMVQFNMQPFSLAASSPSFDDPEASSTDVAPVHVDDILQILLQVMPKYIQHFPGQVIEGDLVFGHLLEYSPATFPSSSHQHFVSFLKSISPYLKWDEYLPIHKTSTQLQVLLELVSEYNEPEKEEVKKLVHILLSSSGFFDGITTEIRFWLDDCCFNDYTAQYLILSLLELQKDASHCSDLMDQTLALLSTNKATAKEIQLDDTMAVDQVMDHPISSPMTENKTLHSGSLITASHISERPLSLFAFYLLHHHTQIFQNISLHYTDFDPSHLPKLDMADFFTQEGKDVRQSKQNKKISPEDCRSIEKNKLKLDADLPESKRNKKKDTDCLQRISKSPKSSKSRNHNTDIASNAQSSPFNSDLDRLFLYLHSLDTPNLSGLLSIRYYFLSVMLNVIHSSIQPLSVIKILFGDQNFPKCWELYQLRTYLNHLRIDHFHFPTSPSSNPTFQDESTFYNANHLITVLTPQSFTPSMNKYSPSDFNTLGKSDMHQLSLLHLNHSLLNQYPLSDIEKGFNNNLLDHLMLEDLLVHFFTSACNTQADRSKLIVRVTQLLGRLSIESNNPILLLPSVSVLLYQLNIENINCEHGLEIGLTQHSTLISFVLNLLVHIFLLIQNFDIQIGDFYKVIVMLESHPMITGHFSRSQSSENDIAMIRLANLLGQSLLQHHGDAFISLSICDILASCFLNALLSCDLLNIKRFSIPVRILARWMKPFDVNHILMRLFENTDQLKVFDEPITLLLDLISHRKLDKGNILLKHYNLIDQISKMKLYPPLTISRHDPLPFHYLSLHFFKILLELYQRFSAYPNADFDCQRIESVYFHALVMSKEVILSSENYQSTSFSGFQLSQDLELAMSLNWIESCLKRANTSLLNDSPIGSTYLFGLLSIFIHHISLRGTGFKTLIHTIHGLKDLNGPDMSLIRHRLPHFACQLIKFANHSQCSLPVLILLFAYLKHIQPSQPSVSTPNMKTKEKKEKHGHLVQKSSKKDDNISEHDDYDQIILAFKPFRKQVISLILVASLGPTLSTNILYYYGVPLLLTLIQEKSLFDGLKAIYASDELDLIKNALLSLVDEQHVLTCTQWLILDKILEEDHDLAIQIILKQSSHIFNIMRPRELAWLPYLLQSLEHHLRALPHQLYWKRTIKIAKRLLRKGLNNKDVLICLERLTIIGKEFISEGHDQFISEHQSFTLQLHELIVSHSSFFELLMKDDITVIQQGYNNDNDDTQGHEMDLQSTNHDVMELSHQVGHHEDGPQISPLVPSLLDEYRKYPKEIKYAKLNAHCSNLDRVIEGLDQSLMKPHLHHDHQSIFYRLNLDTHQHQAKDTHPSQIDDIIQIHPLDDELKDMDEDFYGERWVSASMIEDKNASRLYPLHNSQHLLSFFPNLIQLEQQDLLDRMHPNYHHKFTLLSLLRQLYRIADQLEPLDPSHSSSPLSTIFSSTILSLYLSTYKASLSYIDQRIFQIILIFEKQGISWAQAGLSWGDVARKYHLDLMNKLQDSQQPIDSHSNILIDENNNMSSNRYGYSIAIIANINYLLFECDLISFKRILATLNDYPVLDLNVDSIDELLGPNRLWPSNATTNPILDSQPQFGLQSHHTSSSTLKPIASGRSGEAIKSGSENVLNTNAYFSQLMVDCYDPRFFISAMYMAISQACHFDLEKFTESGCFSIILRSLSLICSPNLMRISCAILNHVFSQLYCCSFPQVSCLRWIVRLIKNSMIEPMMPISSTMASMLAYSVRILVQPQHDLFIPVLQSMISTPIITKHRFPHVGDFFTKKDKIQAVKARSWIIRVLFGAIQTPEDANQILSKDLISYFIYYLSTPFIYNPNFMQERLLIWHVLTKIARFNSELHQPIHSNLVYSSIGHKHEDNRSTSSLYGSKQSEFFCYKKSKPQSSLLDSYSILSWLSNWFTTCHEPKSHVGAQLISTATISVPHIQAEPTELVMYLAAHHRLIKMWPQILNLATNILSFLESTLIDSVDIESHPDLGEDIISSNANHGIIQEINPIGQIGQGIHSSIFDHTNKIKQHHHATISKMVDTTGIESDALSQVEYCTSSTNSDAIKPTLTESSLEAGKLSFERSLSRPFTRALLVSKISNIFPLVYFKALFFSVISMLHNSILDFNQESALLLPIELLSTSFKILELLKPHRHEYRPWQLVSLMLIELIMVRPFRFTSDQGFDFLHDAQLLEHVELLRQSALLLLHIEDEKKRDATTIHLISKLLQNLSDNDHGPILVRFFVFMHYHSSNYSLTELLLYQYRMTLSKKCTILLNTFFTTLSIALVDMQLLSSPSINAQHQKVKEMELSLWSKDRSHFLSFFKAQDSGDQEKQIKRESSKHWKKQLQLSWLIRQIWRLQYQEVSYHDHL